MKLPRWTGAPFVVAALCASIVIHGLSDLRERESLSDANAWASLALGGNAEQALTELAYSRLGDDDEAALVFYRAAAALAPTSPWHAAGIALTAARTGHADEAKRALALARAREFDAPDDERAVLEEWRRDTEEALAGAGAEIK